MSYSYTWLNSETVKWEPTGISANGTVIIGNEPVDNNNNKPVKYEKDTLTDLSLSIGIGSTCSAVSDDGSIIIGRVKYSDYSNKMVTYGNTPTFSESDYEPTGISADGSIIVGAYYNVETNSSSFYKKDSTFEIIPTDGMYSRANGISADGSIIVGGYQKQLEISPYMMPVAYLYTNEEVTELALPEGVSDVPSSATCISADGTVIAGTIGANAFIYKNNEMTQLPSLPSLNDENPYTTIPTGISEDGAIIVGYCNFRFSSNIHAFIYTENEIKYIDPPSDAPTPITPFTYNFKVTGISADGTIIVGRFIDSTGKPRAFKGLAPTSPQSPTNVSAAATSATTAAISWTAPTGSAITSYTVTSSPDGKTATSIKSPATVTGLTKGKAYTFTVTATNSLGTSAASAASNSVTTWNVPAAPTAVTAVAGRGAATVSWNASANNGSAITRYTVTSSPDGKTATSIKSPATVTGLTNGKAYTFTVTATNSVGTSVKSAASNSITTWNVPAAPTAVTAVAGRGAASVSWKASANNGSAITRYTVTSSPDGKTATSIKSPATVTGLTKGRAYTFTVTATNSVGTSVKSAASKSVKPT